MSSADVEKLFRDVMRQPPAEKLKLAGMLLLMDSSKAGMAVSIAKRAIEEIELTHVPDIPQGESLIARVERLEAALSEYAQAHDRYCDAGERQSRWFDASNAVLMLGREISRRREP